MSWAASLIFVTAVGLLWSRNILNAASFLGLEGLLLSAMVLESGSINRGTLIIVGATLVIKAGLIPSIISRVACTWPSKFRQDHPLPLWAYAMGAVLVVAVAHVMQLLKPTGLISHPIVFFSGLASIHLGLIMIVARRHILSQVAALAAIENALMVVAASVAGTLPTFMEFGILIDLTMATGLLVWMGHHIRRQFNSTDVVQLRRLRG